MVALTSVKYNLQSFKPQPVELYYHLGDSFSAAWEFIDDTFPINAGDSVFSLYFLNQEGEELYKIVGEWYGRRIVFNDPRFSSSGVVDDCIIRLTATFDNTSKTSLTWGMGRLKVLKDKMISIGCECNDR